MSKFKCNRDCFNCIFDDCITDSTTRTERYDAAMRDRNFSVSSDMFAKARPRRAKYRGSKN